MARFCLVAAAFSVPAAAQPIFVPIAPVPGTLGTAASGVSGDGAVVVGASDTRAFRWSTHGGTVDLGRLSSFHPYTLAAAASLDGAVVVGSSGFAIATGEASAFRWTSATGMVLVGSAALANAVSDDGSVIAGEALFLSP